MAFVAATSRASVPAGAETITKPSGTSAGDIILFGISSETASGTVTTDASFPFVEAVGSPITVTGDGQRMRLYIREAGASEPATYAFNCSSSVSSMIIASYSGRASGTTPHQISNNPVSTMTASPSIVTGLSVTTSVNGCDIIGFFGADNSASGASTWTKPAAMTERAFVASSNWTSIGLADLTQATAGATGNFDSTFIHSGNAGKLAFIVALAPAGGGGSVSIAGSSSAVQLGTFLPGISVYI